mmetsp:Transcript_14759/g.31080  ORF Transcript_14759/g.31080 Transcript_14759/m.31080 type:complete len:105 (-) Transcript_14759:797-1111(-)
MDRDGGSTGVDQDSVRLVLCHIHDDGRKLNGAHRDFVSHVHEEKGGNDPSCRGIEHLDIWMNVEEAIDHEEDNEEEDICSQDSHLANQDDGDAYRHKNLVKAVH